MGNENPVTVQYLSFFLPNTVKWKISCYPHLLIDNFMYNARKYPLQE